MTELPGWISDDIRAAIAAAEGSGSRSFSLPRACTPQEVEAINAYLMAKWLHRPPPPLNEQLTLDEEGGRCMAQP